MRIHINNYSLFKAIKAELALKPILIETYFTIEHFLLKIKKKIPIQELSYIFFNRNNGILLE
jgi:hypothetical protein